MSSVIRLIFFLALAAVLARAQAPLPPNLVLNANRLFEEYGKHSTLHCSVTRFSPFLDFTFRYEAGFLISVKPEEFTPGGRFGALLRATPEGGKTEVFGEEFDVPQIPVIIAKKLGPKELKKIELQMSMGFAMG